MTRHDVMKASARANAQCQDKKLWMDRNADVPHDAIIEDDDATLQWLNRYSSTSLRFPLFDRTSLLSWGWGLPMLVPLAELGEHLNVD